MATETMGIKGFMCGNYGVKKKWSLFKREQKIRTRGGANRNYDWQCNYMQ